MKYIIVAFISLLSFTSSSQISLGNVHSVGKFLPSSLLSLPDGGYITIAKDDARIKGKGWNTIRVIVTVTKYDKGFKIVKQIKLSGGLNIYSGHYSEIKKIGHKYWFIYLEAQDNDGMGNIKAVEINPVTLAMTEPKIIAAAASLDHRITNSLKVYDLLFISKSSALGKYLSLYVRMTGSDFFLSCLDENLNPLWGRKEKT